MTSDHRLYPRWLIAAALASALSLSCRTKPPVVAAVPDSSAPPAIPESPLLDDCGPLRKLSDLGRTSGSISSGTVARDDRTVAELAELWPPTQRLTDVMRAATERPKRGTDLRDSDLDFDANLVSKTVGTAYVWCTISTLLFRGDLASAKANCSWHAGTAIAQCIARRYGTLLEQLDMAVSDTEAMGRFDSPAIVRLMHRSRLEELGAVEASVPHDENAPGDPFAKAESVLSDPFARLGIGDLPALGGGRPGGFDETKMRVDAGAVDALRRVLRGPNPEGRGYAAVGLSKLGALAPADLRVIERLQRSPEIKFSGGCLVIARPARELFGDLHSHHYLFESTNAPANSE